MTKILCVGPSQAGLLHALSRRLIKATLDSWGSCHGNPEDLDGFAELDSLTLEMEPETALGHSSNIPPEIDALMDWLQDNIGMESPLHFDNDGEIGSSEVLEAMKTLIGERKELIAQKLHLIEACEEALRALDCNCSGDSCDFECSHGIVFKALAHATVPITKLWWNCLCPEEHHQPRDKEFCGACASHISGGTPAEYHEIRADLFLAGRFKEVEALDAEHFLIFPANRPQKPEPEKSLLVLSNRTVEIPLKRNHNLATEEEPTMPSDSPQLGHDILSALWLAKDAGLFERNPKLMGAVDAVLKQGGTHSNPSPAAEDPVASILQDLLAWKASTSTPDAECWTRAQQFLTSITAV